MTQLETVKQIGGPDVKGYLENAEIVGIHWGKTLETTDILGVVGETKEVSFIWKGTLNRYLTIGGGQTDQIPVWYVQRTVRDTNEDLTREEVPYAYWIYVPDNIIAMDELAILANKVPFGEHDWILRYLWPATTSQNDDIIFRLDKNDRKFFLEIFHYYNGRTVVSIENFLMTDALVIAGLRYLGDMLRRKYQGPAPQ